MQQFFYDFLFKLALLNEYDLNVTKIFKKNTSKDKDICGHINMINGNIGGSSIECV